MRRQRTAGNRPYHKATWLSMAENWQKLAENAERRGRRAEADGSAIIHVDLEALQPPGPSAASRGINPGKRQIL